MLAVSESLQIFFSQRWVSNQLTNGGGEWGECWGGANLIRAPGYSVNPTA
jgi:hypothetical protein